MKICSNSAKPKTIYKTLKPQQKCGFNANNPYWGFLCFYGSPQYVGVVFSKQADAFASRRGGARFRLAATYFEKAKVGKAFWGFLFPQTPKRCGK